jgi:hypothetical protein
MLYLRFNLTKEHGPRRITPDVVAPGPVQTDFSGDMVRDDPEINKQISTMTALGPPGVPDRRANDRRSSLSRESLGERPEIRSLRRLGTLKLSCTCLCPDCSWMTGSYAPVDASVFQ